MIDLSAIADGRVRNGEGYWETRNDSGEVISYPPRDTEICFGVEESSFWFAHRNDIIAPLSAGTCRGHWRLHLPQPDSRCSI